METRPRRPTRFLPVLFCLFSAVSLAQSELMSDVSGGQDWPAYGRTYGEQHYSPLKQINSRNIGRLSLAWSLDLPPAYSVSQPLEVGGVLYIATGYSVVRALDAETGKVLWTYDPKAPEAAASRLRFAWGSRGLAWWGGKIYVATLDGRLIALDAKSGQAIWSVRTFAATDESRYITGAPRVFDGKVIIGHGGADVAAVRGYVTTYDAETGRQLWRFWTVPGDPSAPFESNAMEVASKTWAGTWWRYGGGGTVWNAMTYDAESHTIFLGTGNGAPHNHRIRSAGKGDNLFLCSIVALDANSGAYKWHYQVNPAETWDYNAAMDMQLADLDIEGQPRKVLLTAPKNGFFYVIDRGNGKLLTAQPFAKVSWATRIDVTTGRPVENPAARFPDGTTFTLWPGNEGAHNWAPMAFNPTTRLAYIPVVEFASVTNDVAVDIKSWKWPKAPRFAVGVNYAPLPLDDPRGRGLNGLLAWNPVTQRPAWRVSAANTIPGGVMTTAGNLVFEGRADNSFNAYAADSGAKVWSFPSRAGVIAPPISYSVNGRQFVTVLSGIGGITGLRATIAAQHGFDYRSQQRRVLTFALDGGAHLPDIKPEVTRAAADPDFRPDPQAENAGTVTYLQNCVGCHGVSGIPTGQAPDLRRSVVPISLDAFASVVRTGSLISNGMPAFPEFDDRQLGELRQYLRAQAASLRAGESATHKGGL